MPSISSVTAPSSGYPESSCSPRSSGSGQVPRHGADAALLGSYAQERLPVAADVLGMSTHRHRSTVARGNRTSQRSSAVRQPGVGYRGGPRTAEIRGGLPDTALRAGDRAPDAPLAVLPGFARAHRA
ncbi:hypothetical protein ACIP98_26545 [Streptomyces sp. NPDC088354]|uniref:hypothetical protein n=1 Tax=Streptomyces sp. NPDC088354 TaxID=3365856 RepID=UPI003800E52D